MARYKVEYSGFAYVEADSVEEAEELFDDDDTIYDERNVDSVKQVPEFVVTM